MKKMNILVAAGAVALCLAACSKKEAPEQQPEQNGMVTLSFQGNVESASVKATSTMGSDVKSRVMIYPASADVTSATALHNEVLTSDVSGSLSGNAVTILSGSYDFYAVSNNTTSEPIVFTAGSTSVTNGVDYLWQKQTKTVSSSAKSVAFTFAHRAVLVQITLAGANISFANTAMKFKPANDASATMTLADGAIAPATSIKSAFESMTMAGEVGTYMMVPLASVAIPVEITSDVTANSMTNNATVYEATIAAPAGGFVGGKKYAYTATVTGNQIEFSSATISDWDAVDLGQDSELNPGEKPTN